MERRRKNETQGPRLRDLQLWLRWILTDPRGVQNALAGARPRAARSREPKPRLAGFIADAPPVARERRLAVYAEGYFARIADSLASDFEVTRHILGHDGFRNLAAAYLRTHPSRSPNIGDAGSQLPRFVRARASRAAPPWLADLVSLEWALLRAFYADDAVRVEPETLKDITPEDWSRARFALAPSVQLVETAWPVLALWEGRDSLAEGEISRLNRRREITLTFRGRGGVTAQRIDPAWRRALRLMKRGETLGQICADSLAAAAAPSLPEWIRLGIVHHIQFDKS